MDEAKKNEYIKGCYQQNFFGEMLKKETDEHLGYHAEPDGLVLYVGHYPERKEESKFSWELTARLIEALIKDKNYLDEPKEDKQLSLLDMEKTSWRVHTSILQRLKSRLHSRRLPLTSLFGLAAVQREVPREFTAITAERTIQQRMSYS